VKTILFILLALAAQALAYTPPIGIPDPATAAIRGGTAFGWEIDRATPDWPASWLTGTTSATQGYYFIDKTDPSATNGTDPTTGATNTYGHPDTPRLTPPTGSSLVLASGGGAFVYFHAGDYTVTDLTGSWSMYGIGTSATPIWITGNPTTHPSIAVPMNFTGGESRFFVIRDLDFVWSTAGGSDRYGKIDIRPTVAGTQASNILIDGCTLTGEAATDSSGGIAIGASTIDTAIAVSAVSDEGGGVCGLTVASSAAFRVGQSLRLSSMTEASYDGSWTITSVPDGTHVNVNMAYVATASGSSRPDFNVWDVVIHDCIIHTIGMASTGTGDQCGVYKLDRSANTWLLNSLIYEVNGDCVAGAHNANSTTQRAEGYYIGGNTLANPNPAGLTAGENCIDTKAIRYCIISQNYCRGLFGREQGWAMSLHSGAESIGTYDLWVIYNTIHHCSSGIVLGATDGTRRVKMVGNIIYDIKAAYAVQADSFYNGRAIAAYAIGEDNWITDNTFYDYEYGVSMDAMGPGESFTISGNIFHARSGSGYDINLPNGSEPYVTTDYNYFPPAARFFWLNALRDLSYMQGTATQEVHSLAGDPLFTSVTSGSENFALQSGSPAIGVNTEGDPYAMFVAEWGASIAYDITGGSRPVGGAWDMGAVEYGSVYTPPADDPPFLTSATIPTGGTTIVLAFSEAVTPGAGGSIGWALSLSSGSVTASYASGAGTSALTYNLSGTVNSGTTGTVSYTQPGNGIEDGAGNDLATLSGFAITNNSTAGGGGGGGGGAGTITTTTLNAASISVGP
jgi:hypothetical protein